MAVVPLVSMPKFIWPTFAVRNDERAYKRWVERQAEIEQYLPKEQQCQQVQEYLAQKVQP